MRLFTIVVGPLATNCYVIAPDTDNDCAVIDAGAEGGRIADEITRRGLTPNLVLATHGHADHTGGVAVLIARLRGQFVIGSADRDMALHPPEWLTVLLPGFETPPEPACALLGGESLEAGSLQIEAIATPGHTPGSVCYRVGDTVFTGDTLFKGSIGRYDLPGGDGAQELQSVRDRLLALDDATRVCPGHGPATTIGAERRSNPFLRT